MSVILRFPEGPVVGPFASDEDAERYLADFPPVLVEDVEVEELRTPQQYPAPTREDFDPRVP